MNNKFATASKKIQDLQMLYAHLDGLSNRSQWYFEPNYLDSGTCAFVFAHSTADADKRYDSLNILASVLYNAGIKTSLAAVDGVISNVTIAPEHAQLARKMFARYQPGNRATANTYDANIEQEWLRQRQK